MAGWWAYYRAALPDRRTLQARVTRRFALGQIDFDGDPVLQDGEHSEPIVHPYRLLCLILDAAPPEGSDAIERANRFRRELDNSAANDALGLVGADVRRRELSEHVNGAGTTLDRVAREMDRRTSFRPLVFFEQWVVDGHPLHPGSKIKMGMSPGDVIRYAPEWGARPGVAVVAVRRGSCRVASVGPGSPSEILGRENPGLRARVDDHLSRVGLDPSDFEWIPAHPWQVENTLPRLHADAIRCGEIVPIPGLRIPAAALMSVRSMAQLGPRGEPRHQLKTSIDVQMTGAVRTVSPNAAENGPMLTRILDDVQAREAHFGGRFIVLREEVGVYYRPVDDHRDPDRNALLSKHLAAVFREDPEQYVGDGEVALPAAALLAESPVGEGTIGVELIERFGTARGLNDPKQAAAAFLDAYVAIAMPPFLTLMARYGIGLEGHLQNSIVVVRLGDGAPLRMLVRDLGGVRVWPERLAPHRIEAHFHDGSATLADDVEDLRNKVYYAFIQNHLGELIAALARGLAIEEPELWRVIATAGRAAFRDLARDQAIAAQAKADESALFGPTLALKAMTTMRLIGDVTRYTFSEVPNPLAAAERPA